MIVAGYIMAVYKHQEELFGDVAQGQTPVRRKSSTQSQVRFPSQTNIVGCAWFFYAACLPDAHQRSFLFVSFIARFAKHCKRYSAKPSK